ncbi:MAG: hemerythrin family protein [Gammaproteobacteria bacterium]|nr:hemerythrin family protein [Gammaproteobacteria bacterium]
MDIITWSDEYSVGVSELDNQHKKIIALINELNASREISSRSEKLHNILGRIIIYAQNHLDYEENLLRKNAYPDFENHLRKHQDYKLKVSDFAVDILEYREDLPEKLLNYLNQWWMDHILKEDMQYKPFFEEKGIT